MTDLLQVQGLTKRFGGMVACDDVSFAVNAGDIVGLIGPNGAGKSTLFNCICGHLKPSAGDVFLEGDRTTGLPAHELARLGVARTFQLSRPFGELSVFDNVLVGSFVRAKTRREARSIAAAAIDRARFSHRAHVAANELTSTERKRLELARALAVGPKLLFLDEVAAGSSEAEIDSILDLVRELAREGLGVVLVEHVLPAVMSVAQRILVLDFGRLVAQGTPTEVLSNKQAVEVYFGSFQSA